MNIINDIKGNPLALLAGAAIGYYIADQKMKTESIERKVIVVAGAGLLAHLLYVQLTTKKHEPINANLGPINGVLQTKKRTGTNGNIE